MRVREKFLSMNTTHKLKALLLAFILWAILGLLFQDEEENNNRRIHKRVTPDQFKDADDFFDMDEFGEIDGFDETDDVDEENYQ